MSDEINLENLTVIHDKDNTRFTMEVNGNTARVDYELNKGTMRLVYSLVPYSLRGQGVGKVLVEKTFQKLTDEGYEAVAVCAYIKSVARNSDTWSKIIK